MRLALLVWMAAAALAGQTLDFEFFKTQVQPIFLARRPGHARCYACHSTATPFRLQRLSPGAATWSEEQTRKNFQAASNMVNLSDVDASPLLIFPLAESAGGNHFHPGGKHWESKSDPEWQILIEWARGKKGNP